MATPKTKTDANIQPDLPGASAPRPRLPKALKDLDEEICAAEQEAGEARSRSNELRGKALQIMLEKGIGHFPLSNGGEMVMKEGKKTLKYIAPKIKELLSDDDTEDDEE
jgi:hypothetical protein